MDPDDQRLGEVKERKNGGGAEAVSGRHRMKRGRGESQILKVGSGEEQKRERKKAESEWKLSKRLKIAIHQ